MKQFLALFLGVMMLSAIALSQAPRQLASDAKQDWPLSPAESLKKFTTPEDLVVEEVLSEPDVKQPLFVNFDERGRMWVVQYLQYPFPAGLKRLSHDRFWRVVYDRVPPPPPKHFRGADKITIHEDTDGDGAFDTQKTFVDGLSIATSVERGRGGVWVLNPPYLLFYPDENNDDVPDGDPVVHLEGFGMEDTHSVTNSLRWGPDGWLYASQGSTVSGKVKRYGVDEPPVSSMGQLIWRYHPEMRKYEIFAEGGGNAFGVELDEKGRIYSGHNGGDTRGFHYVQGGYYRKGFDKHGPLSNPYTFGYFPPMKHAKVQRFTHNFVIYEADNLPASYRGKLFAIDPLQARIFLSKVERDGSSFGCTDIGFALSSTDEWFRPVDIKLGPDGGIYVADFYDQFIAHLRHHDNKIDKDHGRVYRIRGKDAKPQKPADLGKLPTVQLLDKLTDPNRWTRQTALRLIGDRKDGAIIPELKKRLAGTRGQDALEYLWALNLSGGLDEGNALELMEHAEPFVRVWTVRLLGDREKVSSPVAAKLIELARKEPNVEVRSQLACSARRLPAIQGMPVVRELLQRTEDKDDIHLPLLLWWAIEAKAASDREQVVSLFSDAEVWNWPIVKEHILENVMRRYAQAGSRKDLVACAELLELAPSDAHARVLLAGFEKAFSGRSLAHIPDELVKALAKRGGGSLALRVRQGDAKAIEEALRLIGDDKAKKEDRLLLVQVLGEVRETKAIGVLLDLLAKSKDDGLLQATLAALQPHQEARIAAGVLARYKAFSPDVRATAETLLASRASSSVLFLDAVESGKLDAQAIPMPVVRKMLLHRDKRIGELVRKHWGEVQGATTEEMRKQVDRLAGVIRTGSADHATGKTVFTNTCAKCHQLFGEGGYIGPDLTPYKRSDIDNLLIHVVNPSAEIREGFENYLVLTEDGRSLMGFLMDQDNQVVVLRGADGQNVVIDRKTIEEMSVVPQSLMPDNLLTNLSDQQVRDLFAYLRSGQPLRN